MREHTFFDDPEAPKLAAQNAADLEEPTVPQQGEEVSCPKCGIPTYNCRCANGE